MAVSVSTYATVLPMSVYVTPTPLLVFIMATTTPPATSSFNDSPVLLYIMGLSQQVAPSPVHIPLVEILQERASF